MEHQCLFLPPKWMEISSTISKAIEAAIHGAAAGAGYVAIAFLAAGSDSILNFGGKVVVVGIVGLVGGISGFIVGAFIPEFERIESPGRSLGSIRHTIQLGASQGGIGIVYRF